MYEKETRQYKVTLWVSGHQGWEPSWAAPVLLGVAQD